MNRRFKTTTSLSQWKIGAAILFVATSAFSFGCRDAGPTNNRADDEQNEQTVEAKNEKRPTAPIRTVDDWRRLERSEPPRRIVCDGPGALRLATYLQSAQDVVAVEQVEKTNEPISPYRVVNPQFADAPVFGEGHGRDNVEFLLSLNPPPDVILRVDSPGAGIDPQVLTDRTGIPVVVAPSADFCGDKAGFEKSLFLFGEVLGKRERANEVVAFVDSQIEELQRLAKSDSNESSTEKRPSVYLGGLSYRGARGVNSTTTDYPPFNWLGLSNPAAELKSDSIGADYATVSPEQIVAWNPEFVFLDLGTTLGNGDANGLAALTSSPIYRSVDAIRENRVFALYPNNNYNSNVEAILVNAFYIGKTVFPERFANVDFGAKSDEICRFLLDETLRDKTPSSLEATLYRRIAVESDKR